MHIFVYIFYFSYVWPSAINYHTGTSCKVTINNSNNSMAQGDSMTDRSLSWKENLDLAQDLEQHVVSNTQHSEILGFVKWDYGMYAWSIPTLDGD